MAYISGEQRMNFQSPLDLCECHSLNDDQKPSGKQRSENSKNSIWSLCPVRGYERFSPDRLDSFQQFQQKSKGSKMFLGQFQTRRVSDQILKDFQDYRASVNGSF